MGQLQQLGDAHDGMTEEVAADVIGVIVGGEHTGEAHVIGLEESDYFPGGIGGVHRDGLATFPVPDEVHEIDHLASHGIVARKVAAGKQLAEVKAFPAHGSSGSGDQSASLVRRRSFENTSTMGRCNPMRRCSRSMASSWSHRTSVTATPPSPARAVRPDLCR